VRNVKRQDDGSIDIVPGRQGRNTYTTAGHFVVDMADGSRKVAQIKINPDTGELQVHRLKEADAADDEIGEGPHPLPSQPSRPPASEKP
jgi:hypothetical protein